ncbi:MAG: 2-amino-4-hydroxy-6-hydroxymethyldihydropteridine diphosphokinase [Pseudomonadales bacterium]|nr:2-amino-4-hydroxy-6-hydroxymethyldihydropteridine diphosphokinase [Pseudomonadales bacterium]MCP5356945.1 2-amino-4-hydroxy-6-hydroxymethyldihydropteridine diphosphokinase [Pseudomonadales bacterium]
MPLVALSLGSNISPERHLRDALDALESRYGYLRTSSVFESEAVGFAGANFLNMVVVLETDESLQALSRFLKEYEDRHGRVRSGPKASGRTVDIDILLYGEQCGSFEDVELPRPEIIENAFVLWPLAQLLGDEALPGTAMRIGDLWQHYDQEQRLWPVDFTWQGRRLSRADDL